MAQLSSRDKAQRIDLDDVLIRTIEAADIEDFLSVVARVVDREVQQMISPVGASARISEFIQQGIAKGLPHLVCMHKGALIGWAEITPCTRASMSHIGVLGMGLLADYRGKGLGRRLLDRVVEKAAGFGLEKIELEVLSDNAAAIALYEKLGFELEGVKRKARRAQGAYADLVLMAKFID